MEDNGQIVAAFSSHLCCGGDRHRDTEVQRHREVQRERKAFPFRLGPSNMPEQNGEVPPPH